MSSTEWLDVKSPLGLRLKEATPLCPLVVEAYKCPEREEVGGDDGTPHLIDFSQREDSTQRSCSCLMCCFQLFTLLFMGQGMFFVPWVCCKPFPFLKWKERGMLFFFWPLCIWMHPQIGSSSTLPKKVIGSTSISWKCMVIDPTFNFGPQL